VTWRLSMSAGRWMIGGHQLEDGDTFEIETPELTRVRFERRPDGDVSVHVSPSGRETLYEMIPERQVYNLVPAQGESSS